MKPLDQTMYSSETSKGNCLVACVASILEMNIEDLPHFITYSDWAKVLKEFLNENGYELQWHYGYGYDAPKGYSIATGLSPRARKDEALYHAVVCLDGEVVHDPHFSRDGLCGPIMYYMRFEDVKEA